MLGDHRTAEELGRSFARTPIRSSSDDRVRADGGGAPEIVVATPGAEPVAEGGYAAVVLLDTWLPLARADLRTDEEALRRWVNAAALVAPGGRVLAVGDPAHPALQALVRWDVAGFAERETTQRIEAHLPPASRMATITGEPGAVDDALTLLDAARGGRGARTGRPPRRRVARGHPGAAGAGPGALGRAARAAAAALGAQARRRPGAGRPVVRLRFP